MSDKTNVIDRRGYERTYIVGALCKTITVPFNAEDEAFRISNLEHNRGIISVPTDNSTG